MSTFSSFIKQWSTTPASNGTTPNVVPYGWPEGMAPSSVNNTARQQMADHRYQWQDAEWFCWGDVASKASTTSFKIASDVTSRYLANRRVKILDNTTLYATITSSSYSAPDTTVNLSLDSGTLSTTTPQIALSIMSPSNTALPYNPKTVVQQVYSLLSTVQTGTTQIPMDDTIPQNTEGDQYITVTITPRNANNILKVEALVFCAHSAGTAMTAAIFIDSNASANVAGSNWANAANTLVQINVTTEVVAGGVAAITFKLRVGCTNAGTTTINGTAGGRLLGGALGSSLIVTEFLP